MPYPTTAALVAASSVPELTNLTVEQQDSLRSAAIVGIESYTGQSFEAVEEDVEVRNEGTNELYLPRRLETLDGISSGGIPVDDLTSLEVSLDKSMLRIGRVVPNYYEQALFEVSGGDYPHAFPKGIVVVHGTWGWETTPDAVVVAIRFDMEDSALADSSALTASVHVARKLGLKDLSQGNLSLTLGGSPTLTPRVQTLLDPYVWNAGVGRLV